VARSASGLKPGMTITIRYSTILNRGRMVGGSPLPVLAPGLYPAYLTRAGEVFSPAAGGFSFAMGGPGVSRLAADLSC